MSRKTNCLLFHISFSPKQLHILFLNNKFYISPLLYTILVYMSINIFLYVIMNLVIKMFKRIRDLREDHDLLQKHLAEYLHCTQVAYSRYECGTRDIPTEVLIKLADYYHTSTDYLLGLTDVKTPYPKKLKNSNRFQK